MISRKSPDSELKRQKALLDGGYPAGAYYLMGYAVECALKACIAKQTKRYDFPPKPSSVNAIYKIGQNNFVTAIQYQCQQHEIFIERARQEKMEFYHG